MDDAFTFAERGDHSYEIPLLLVMAIVDEDVLTMKTFQAHLNLLQVRLSTFPQKYHLLQKYISRVLAPLFIDSKKLESSSRKDGQMKEVILNELCENEYKDCLQFGWSHFETVRNTHNATLTRRALSNLPRYVRTSIYMAGGKLGNQSDFDLLLRLFVIEEYGEEKERIFKGMVENNEKHNMYRLFDQLVEKIHLTGYELHNFLHSYLRRHAYKSNHYETYFAENRERFRSLKYPVEIQKALYISYAKASTVENLGKLENVTLEFYSSSNESWFRDEWSRQKSRIEMAFEWSHSFAPTIFTTLSSLVNDST
ncbi:hypothetical protein PMAYCL1PPCAC_29362 [Pristionchus mayeri]|uniref:ERAP1-like C-terminal domain-containing protein n=1 Tax=Pristionchus mayeri TaxID=1317129 RepID=A0AAN5DBI8_9BILA|nr:hypothetical protein PMAYCL1PPCAC_29362 [Pristionchus mayeri]